MKGAVREATLTEKAPDMRETTHQGLWNGLLLLLDYANRAKKEGQELPEFPEKRPSAIWYAWLVCQTMRSRRFFFTAKGRTGIGPDDFQQNDVITV